MPCLSFGIRNLFVVVVVVACEIPCSSVSKESTCGGSGRSSGEGIGNPLHILAWRIPWTEEPGGLQSMGSQESDTT